MEQKVFLVGILIGFTFCMAANSQSNDPVPIGDISKRVKIDADLQATIDAGQKGAPTNGLFCLLQFYHSGGQGLYPVCDINVVNITTNMYRSFLKLPLEALCQVELFNSDGKAVEKTTEGKSFETWTPEELADWLHKKLVARARNRFFPVLPFDYALANRFSVPEIFQLKEPGEYELHLKMQLNEAKWDDSGQTYVKTIWLPEVVAKVQIRAEDIPVSDKLPTYQTNAAAKHL